MTHAYFRKATRKQTQSNLNYVYQMARQAWIMRHPNATAKEAELAMSALAKKIGV